MLWKEFWVVKEALPVRLWLQFRRYLSGKTKHRFRVAYIDYVTPIGTFDIGLMNDGIQEQYLVTPINLLAGLNGTKPLVLFTLKLILQKSKIRATRPLILLQPHRRGQ